MVLVTTLISDFLTTVHTDSVEQFKVIVICYMFKVTTIDIVLSIIHEGLKLFSIYFETNSKIVLPFNWKIYSLLKEYYFLGCWSTNWLSSKFHIDFSDSFYFLSLRWMETFSGSFVIFTTHIVFRLLWTKNSSRRC